MFLHVQRWLNPIPLSTCPLILSTSGGLESQVSSRWSEDSVGYHAISLRIEELKKAGEICEDFLQYVGVMNMATNVQSDFCWIFRWTFADEELWHFLKSVFVIEIHHLMDPCSDLNLKSLGEVSWFVAGQEQRSRRSKGPRCQKSKVILELRGLWNCLKFLTGHPTLVFAPAPKECYTPFVADGSRASNFRPAVFF